MATSPIQAISPSPTAWDNFVLSHPRGYFLQLSAWSEQKNAYGWSVERVALQNEADEIVAGAQFLFRPLPMKLGTMAYLPYGAYVSDDSQWNELWKAIHACAKTNGAAFLKWEPGFDFASDPSQWGFDESPQRIQPPNTVMIDITGDDDTIQARMNTSTRRNIRKAYKNDIHYYEATPDDLHKFTTMMDVTGERNDFGVHESAYYKLMYELFVPDHATLILADHEGDTLAANLVISVGDTAIYLEGASSNVKRKLMASYGVQWEAIKWAQNRGCTKYDMWGIPDESEEVLEEQFQERIDGLWSVYRFKRGWGGDVVRSAGAWDYVYNSIVYMAYKTALKVRG
ncbi:MAG: peptidoglycan bridge formation glycyltransferase FemA/FemB family protein [Chloroflexota bacterium]